MSPADGAPLAAVRERVRAACERAGRDPRGVTVIAVSKLQPVEKIVDLSRQGQTEFGENYVQELTGKMTALPSLRWHLIGHLQRNKVKFVSGKCALIHSVDSADLARALDRRAGENGVAENILLQVNLGGEDSKEGFSAGALAADFAGIAALPNLRIHGLMTMPPLRNEPEANRPLFARLRALRDGLRDAAGGRHPMDQLSMGTSHDFEIAVEEGATLIRVGSVLFGARPG